MGVFSINPVGNVSIKTRSYATTQLCHLELHTDYESIYPQIRHPLAAYQALPSYFHSILQTLLWYHGLMEIQPT